MTGDWQPMPQRVDCAFICGLVHEGDWGGCNMNGKFTCTGGAIRRLLSTLVASSLVTLLLAGCVVPHALMVKPPPEKGEGQLAPAPLDDAEGMNPHLAAALTYAPASVDLLSFTDWARLKEVAGVEKLTSANSFEERWAFMRPLA